jgi:hypothetical protein
MNKSLSPKELSRVSNDKLADLAKRGIVQVMVTPTVDIAHIKKTDLPQYKKHAHLKGKKISVSEASREYNIPKPTISRWAKRGLIKILERTDREVYLDMADVAYCSEIYKEKKGQGTWMFNDDGTPYVPSQS